MQTLTVNKPVRPSKAAFDNIVIRRPCTADVPGLAALFLEMQAHYGRPVSAATATRAAILACSPPTQAFDPRVIVALVEGRIVGSLVMNVTFPAFELTRSLYIRDLYVSRQLRRSGVGALLVRAGARTALDEGFSALEWTTETVNTAARRMYEACGAKQLDRTYYRLFDDSLATAAS